VQSFVQPIQTKENNKVSKNKYSGNALARLIPQLAAKAKHIVRDLDSHNDLKFMRLKTIKYEILIAPDN